MSKYIITIEGDFEKGGCRKCPIGAASDILKGKGVIYSCMYALGGGSKEFCPLEEATVAKNATVGGEWENIGHNGTFKCSICGKHASKSNFCPNCGAKMKGGKE